jgi:hypothetical protein
MKSGKSGKCNGSGHSFIRVSLRTVLNAPIPANQNNSMNDAAIFKLAQRKLGLSIEGIRKPAVLRFFENDFYSKQHRHITDP